MRYPDISITLFTSKTPIPYTEKFTFFESSKASNISIISLELPSAFSFLYSVPAGESRYRWDMESIAFANVVSDSMRSSGTIYDLIWTYYLMDFPFKGEIPTILNLLGYPKSKSDYREAILSQYSYIVPISENVVEKWNRLLEIPVIKDYAVLHQGVSHNRAKKDQNLFDKKKLNIVFAGRLIERKGILLLLKAIRIICIDFPEINLILHIYGEGPLKVVVEKYIYDNALGERIIFHGHVSNLPEAFSEADFCIFPSLEGEGLMSVVLEAMHYNGTVITTRGNGSEEFISDERSGYLIKSGDINDLVKKIVYLSLHPEKIEATKEDAKHNVAGCTWDAYCENFIRICEKVISKAAQLE